MKQISYLILFATLALACSSSDSEQDPTTTITVSDFNITIPENILSGTIIGTINASVSSGSISFSITEQSSHNAVVIDGLTGELRVSDASAFDYEINTSIMGTIKISQGTLYKNASFTILIENVYENVYEGDVSLQYQYEVDSFGKSNYTEVTGTLEINQYNEIGNITDLSPLISIQKIGDRLRLISNNITSLNGLENLQSVNAIFISGNPLLEDISALEKITEIPLFVAISGSPFLSNLNGLQNITSIGAGLYLSSLPIEDLNAFSNLTYLAESIQLANNSSLNNLSGLSKIQGNLNILQINYCPLLVSLEGLNNIGPNISSRLVISDNQNLSDISALSNVTNIDDLSILNMPNLKALNGLHNVSSISGKLEIGENDILGDISALSNVTSFNLNNLGITANPLLSNLDGLNNLTEVAEQIIIFYNGLQNLQGLESLESVGIDFYVIDYKQLTDLCALTLLAQNNGVNEFNTEGNGFNPTLQDIANGECSL